MLYKESKYKHINKDAVPIVRKSGDPVKGATII